MSFIKININVYEVRYIILILGIISSFILMSKNFICVCWLK